MEETGSSSDIFEPLIASATPSHDKDPREMIDKINSKNAKRIAAGLVALFVVYHSCIHTLYGKNSCKWLLSDGRYKGDMGWQPYGCMMHIYSEVDKMRCMKYLSYWDHRNTFAFIGDDRIRDLYLSFIKQFNSPEQSGKHDKKIVLESAYLNSNFTFVNDELRLRATFIYSPYISKMMIDLFHEWKNSGKAPSVIVMGSAVWYIKEANGTAINLEQYINNLTLMIQPMDSLCKKSYILWELQAPVNEDKLNASNSVITNKVIDEYNEAAMDALKYSCIQLWSSSRLVAQECLDEMPNGMELSEHILNTDIQILLNMYCNNHMNHSDGTCCAATEPYTNLQLIVFIALAICGLCGVLVFLFSIRFYSNRKTGLYTVITSLAKLSFIMAYFYLCDRTNFFMKENKYYSAVSFWLPLAYVFTLGLFFTEDSRYTKVLNRDQTEEWKGWMQLVILIYQMTGADSVIPIKNHILILVSSYLFLTGYGHFFYMWFRTDAGFVRLFQVIFRLNFFVIILCLCMNRPYQFYFFVPVVTFWFLTIYLVLWLPPRITVVSSDGKPFQYIYILLKIIFTFVVVSILYMSEVFFEKLFVTRPWKALFVTTDDDVGSWWLRWKIDRFSSLYGVLFALVLLLAQRYSIMDDNNHNNLFSVRLSLAVSLCSLLGLTAISTYAIFYNDFEQYKELHSYIVIIPIICYILLRNISGILRNRYSNFFAFFGKISLELFVSHFHIWLTADSNGVLVLIPQYPVLNALVVSYIFVCIAHEVHDITMTLMPYVIPSDWKVAARNVIIFLLLLVPIGIRDGMF